MKAEANYRVRAIVIPRKSDEDRKRLECCVAFVLLRPAVPTEVKLELPLVFRNWPKNIDQLLKKASMAVLDEKGKLVKREFKYELPKDLAHTVWTLGDAEQLWEKMFKKVLEKKQSIRPDGRMEELYRDEKKNKEPGKSDFVNPESGTNLRPTDRFESPKTVRTAGGAAARLFQDARGRDEVARRELDVKLVQAMKPEHLQDAVASLARWIDVRPGDYHPETVRTVAELRSGTRPDLLSAQALVNGAGLHEMALKELVNHIVDTAFDEDRAEQRRFERLVESSRKTPAEMSPQEQQKKNAEMKEGVEGALFEENFARIRQYPGLARRLLMVLHGWFLWEDLPAQSTIQLELQDHPDKYHEYFETPKTAYFWDTVNGKKVFRPMSRNKELFAPNWDDFLKHHVFDPSLYQVTQDDFVRTMGRRMAEDNESTIEKNEPSRTRVQPAELNDAEKTEEERKRHRVNSLQIVSKPLIDTTKKPAGVAEGIDHQIKKSAATVKAAAPITNALYAEDLMMGYSVFARKAGGKDGEAWRSLCRRIVHVGPGINEPAWHTFEEEGYIASGVLKRPNAVVGVLQKREEIKSFVKVEEWGIKLEVGVDGQTVMVKEILVDSFAANPRLDLKKGDTVLSIAGEAFHYRDSSGKLLQGDDLLKKIDKRLEEKKLLDEPLLMLVKRGSKETVIKVHREWKIEIDQLTTSTKSKGSVEYYVDTATVILGNFSAHLSVLDLREGDYVYLTLRETEGVKKFVSEVELYPIMNSEIDKFDGTTTSQYFRGLGTSKRANESFTVYYDDKRTKLIDEEGKAIVLPDKALTWDDQNKRLLLVEGDARAFVRNKAWFSPANPDMVYLVKPGTFDDNSLKNRVGELVHREIPREVLRHYHLKTDDKFNEWQFPKPNATGYDAPVKAAELELIREVTGPLTYLRGEVVAVRFEMTVTMSYDQTLVAWRPQFADNLQPLIIPNDKKLEKIVVVTSNIVQELTAQMTPSLGAVHNLPGMEQQQRRLLRSAQADRQTNIAWDITIPPMFLEENGIVIPENKTFVAKLIGKCTPILGGVATYSVQLEIESMQKLGDAIVPVTVPSLSPLTWILTIAGENGKRESIRYIAEKPKETTPERYYDAELLEENPQLIHPSLCLNVLVDVIGVTAGKELIGRAYPQGIPGLAKIEDKKTIFAELFEVEGKESRNEEAYRGLDVSESGVLDFFLIRAEKINDRREWKLWPMQSGVFAKGVLTELALIAEIADASEAESRHSSGGKVRFIQLNKKAGVLQSKAEQVFQGLGKDFGARPLSQLREGETVLAYGTYQFEQNSSKASFTPATISEQKLKLSSQVVGKLATERQTNHDKLQDNTNTKIVKALVTTAAGQRLRLTYETPTGKELVEETYVIPVNWGIIAKNLVKYKVATTAPAGAQEPLNLLASDLIARWGGWSLTAEMPGRSDEDAGQPGKGDTAFYIRCDRDATSVNLMQEAGEWKLPALRFDHRYEFCLRRTDLAGNHLYDEGPLPINLPATTVGGIAGLMDDSPFLEALGVEPPVSNAFPISLGDEPIGMPLNTFQRSDWPGKALLAFPAGEPMPVWRTATTKLEDKRKADNVAIPKELQLVAHERDQLLVLFTDVLGRVPGACRDAQCYVLPPEAAVETVLMHGKLDCYDARQAAEIIRLHERHIEQQYKGVDTKDRLNYFGDPFAEKVRIDYVVYEEDLPQDGKKTQVAMSYTTWPCPAAVHLELDGKTRTDVPTITKDLSGQSSVGVHSEKDCASFKISMAPGGVGFAALLPMPSGNKQPTPSKPWQKLQVMHVTNGAWLRPRWTKLEERIPEIKPEQPGNPLTGNEPQRDSQHELLGSFVIDTATTEAYQVTAFWNECWDESLMLGWEEATLALESKSGTITKASLQGAPSQPMGGYGYGREAACIIIVPQGVTAPKKWPKLTAKVEGNRVTEVTLHDGGEGYDPETMSVRVIRRPPLMRIAQAKVHRTKGVVGPLRSQEVQICETGGFYMSPPLVVVSDKTGNGYGAKLTANLNGSGGVESVTLEDGGAAYSDDVEIKFYTHQWNFSERPIHLDFEDTVVQLGERAEPRGRDGTRPAEPFYHGFSDTASRVVDYYVTAHCRHRQLLLDAARKVDAVDALCKQAPETVARMQVPRISQGLPLCLTARMRPAMPRLSHLLPAFHWLIRAGDGSQVEKPSQFFLKQEQGELSIRRQSVVRVYLHRPWHVSGPEMLGVVVLPAILNTLRTEGNLEKYDRGKVNRLEDFPEIAGSPTKVELADEVVPPKLRHLVSRWGFDPIWNEHALPPLNLGNFPNAIAESAYLLPSLDETAQAAMLALHPVYYDGAKNRWYSDIAINLNDRGKPMDANPFVRLNLVTHQMNGLAGQRSSDIAIADLFPLMGERTLKIVRVNQGKFRLVLRGGFEEIKPTGPQRRVVVELHRHDPTLPEEIEMTQWPSDARAAEAIRDLDMAWDKATNSYVATLNLPGEMTHRLGRGELLLVVKEKEYHRTVSPQPGGFGDRTEMLGQAPYAYRVPCSFSFLI